MAPSCPQQILKNKGFLSPEKGRERPAFHLRAGNFLHQFEYRLAQNVSLKGGRRKSVIAGFSTAGPGTALLKANPMQLWGVRHRRHSSPVRIRSGCRRSIYEMRCRSFRWPRAAGWRSGESYVCRADDAGCEPTYSKFPQPVSGCPPCVAGLE